MEENQIKYLILLILFTLIIITSKIRQRIEKERKEMREKNMTFEIRITFKTASLKDAKDIRDEIEDKMLPDYETEIEAIKVIENAR